MPKSKLMRILLRNLLEILLTKEKNLIYIAVQQPLDNMKLFQFVLRDLQYFNFLFLVNFTVLRIDNSILQWYHNRQRLFTCWQHFFFFLNIQCPHNQINFIFICVFILTNEVNWVSFPCLFTFLFVNYNVIFFMISV